MADFYDNLNDLDIEGYDPGDPNDPLNVLLEQIREDLEDTSPKAYVLNEQNLKKFMIVYKNIDLLVESKNGKYVDIKADPRDVNFYVSVEFPLLNLTEESMRQYQRIILVADSVDICPSVDDSILMEVEVRSVYEEVSI